MITDNFLYMEEVMKYFEIKVYTDSLSIEAVSAMLYELDVEGIVIEDPNDPIFSESYEGDWDYVDKDVYNFETEDAIVKGYFKDIDPEIIKRNIQNQIAKLSDFGLKQGSGKVEISEIVNEDWAHEWKKYFKPFKIGNIVIKPTWEEYTAYKDDIIIEMDPGSAFGSGTHETTSMCVALIDKYIRDEDLVFDIGCGTGILGITAAKLGASEVKCVDIDELAVIASEQNAILNNVSDKIEVFKGDLTDVLNKKADIVIANIIADVIIKLTDDIHNYLKDEGVFIASGIIDDKLDEVLEAMKSREFNILEVKTAGEWNAIAMKLK